MRREQSCVCRSMNRPPARSAIDDAVRVLVRARRSGRLLEALPPASRPGSVDEAHAIQDATVLELGDAVAGWKVLPPIDGQIARGVLLRSRVFASPATVPATQVPSDGCGSGDRVPVRPRLAAARGRVRIRGSRGSRNRAACHRDRRFAVQRLSGHCAARSSRGLRIQRRVRFRDVAAALAAIRSRQCRSRIVDRRSPDCPAGRRSCRAGSAAPGRCARERIAAGSGRPQRSADDDGNVHRPQFREARATVTATFEGFGSVEVFFAP